MCHSFASAINVRESVLSKEEVASFVYLTVSGSKSEPSVGYCGVSTALSGVHTYSVSQRMAAGTPRWADAACRRRGRHRESLMC